MDDQRKNAILATIDDAKISEIIALVDQIIDERATGEQIEFLVKTIDANTTWDRKKKSFLTRLLATHLAYTREQPGQAPHPNNGEEEDYSGQDLLSFMSFTKGLAHEPSHGLVKNSGDPTTFRAAIDSGTVADFDNIPIAYKAIHTGDTGLYYGRTGNPDLPNSSKPIRKWESPTTGFVYSLEGPDCQAVTMPPAPALLKDNTTAKPQVADVGEELVAEMVEVYWLALLRDVPFENFDNLQNKQHNLVDEAITDLENLDYYKNPDLQKFANPRYQSVKHENRGSTRPAILTPQNIFRGQSPGDDKGPFLSQFLLMGSSHLGNAYKTGDGQLQYGSITVDMRVRVATPEKDYMTRWNEWLDVQNGANVRDIQTYDDKVGFRHISTLRDMATYVHHDQLYESYLNALFWLLNVGAPVDDGFKDSLNDTKSTEGFALWGGPHILSLMTEVATRALKAVRFQKFNTHLRARPEALAGLMAAQQDGKLPDNIADKVAPFYGILKDLGLLEKVSTHNKAQGGEEIPLLPMAFPEGSPMHPCYGAGHATVAGACVTILKAFFNENSKLFKDASGNYKADPGFNPATDKPFAFVPEAPTSATSNPSLKDIGNKLVDGEPLTVGHELNKLAFNISIARNMAGVHFYSDYIDSLRMGEKIAVGILEEQSVCYPKDPFEINFTSFDGEEISIKDGKITRGGTPISVNYMS